MKFCGYDNCLVHEKAEHWHIDEHTIRFTNPYVDTPSVLEVMIKSSIFDRELTAAGINVKKLQEKVDREYRDIIEKNRIGKDESD